MRHGTVFGKSTGLGGAVGLLFPDGRKKDKAGKGKEKKKRSMDLGFPQDDLIWEQTVRNQEVLAEHEEDTVRQRLRLELAHQQSLAATPPADATAGPIPSPAPIDDRTGATQESNSSTFASDAERNLSPSPSEAMALNQHVYMNPSIASFISARRRANKDHRTESGSEDSELESLGQSITSSTLFYNARQRKLSPTSALGQGSSVFSIPMPPSPPTSASSPSRSSGSHLHRLNRLSQLSQLSYASPMVSDTDDAEYATADDHEAYVAPEEYENADIPDPALTSQGSDAAPPATPTRVSHVHPATPPTVQTSKQKADLEEAAQSTPTRNILDKDHAFAVKGQRKDQAKIRNCLGPLPSLESGPETRPEMQATATREANVATDKFVPIGQASPGPAGKNKSNLTGMNEPAFLTASATLRPDAAMDSVASSTRSSTDGPMDDATGRSGTFGYATSSSGTEGSGKRTRRGRQPSARLASIACSVSSPFAGGVEGATEKHAFDNTGSPAVGTPTSPVPIHLSPLPSIPPPPSRARSREPVVAPRPPDLHSLHSSRGPSRSHSPLQSAPGPLTIPSVRSSAQAHNIFPPSPTSPGGVAPAGGQQDDRNDTSTSNNVNDLSSLSTTTTWYYNPTSPTGKCSIRGSPGGFSDYETARGTPLNSAVSPTSPNGLPLVNDASTHTAASTSTTDPAAASTGSATGARTDSTVTLRSTYADAPTSPTALTMSTTSLNSARLMTLRPPSLSAFSGGARGQESGMPRSHTRPHMTSRTSSSSYQPRSQSQSRTKRHPSHRGDHQSSCSACDSESDSTSSDEEDVNILRSPHSPPLDFTTPRPGFDPSPPPQVPPSWSSTRPVKSFAPVPERDSYVSGSGDGEPNVSGLFGANGLAYEFGNLANGNGVAEAAPAQRTSEPESESTVPPMTNSTSSRATNVTELQTPSNVGSPAGTEDGVPPTTSPGRGPHPLRMVVASGVDDLISPTATLDVPISQFARASFGCDGTEADKERQNIMAAAARAPQHDHLDRPADSDSEGSDAINNSDCDSDLDVDSQSDGEYPYHDSYVRAQVRSQARAEFFGSGSASARRARTSHTSLSSIPANHEELAFDLTHLRSAVLPAYGARASLSSLRMPDDRYTPAIPMPRQKSLVNLMRKHEAMAARKHPVGPRRSQSHPRLHSLDAVPVVDDDDEFHVSKPPSQRRMWEAATSFLYDEDGNIVCFGDLFPQMPLRTQTIAEETEDEDANVSKMNPVMKNTTEDGPPPRTVVFFIRSFYCGLCQDYTLASISRLDPVLLKKHNISVIVIGPGHWKVLKPYRELFKCPFPFYAEPTRRLYHTMGLIMGHPTLHDFSTHREAYHQASLPVQLTTGLVRSARHLPLSYNPGNLFQLGGEFILGAGYRCLFAHRMKYFGDHMEARKVLMHAGVDHPEITPLVLSEGERSAREELDREAQAASLWQEERDRELDRMRRKKTARRKFGNSVLDLEKAMSPDPNIDDDARSEWAEYVHSMLNPKRASMASKRASLLSQRMSMLENGVSGLLDKRSSQVGSEKRLSYGEKKERRISRPLPTPPSNTTPIQSPIASRPPRPLPKPPSIATPPRSSPLANSSSLPAVKAKDVAAHLRPAPVPALWSRDSVTLSYDRTSMTGSPGPIPVPTDERLTDSSTPQSTRTVSYNDFGPDELASPRNSSSPKPPYRPVVSPTRKPVPMLSDEEEKELNRESARISMVVV